MTCIGAPGRCGPNPVADIGPLGRFARHRSGVLRRSVSVRLPPNVCPRKPRVRFAFYAVEGTSVADYQTLIDGRTTPADVCILDVMSDGLDQIMARVQGRTDIDALYIISHGRKGTLYFGNTVLNSENLSAYRKHITSDFTHARLAHIR